ncbi:TaqI-like C-terminal specificity domain-containing protein [Rubrivirga sp. S365]|uniref:site-specific DNA-methyltransferase (adenine-specific) n=1 Tax=Rubrivirga litoralis TaxID=3075598 RepID=A0ABU3BSJ4_9BACT|nr:MULTISPECIES: Eco57I restriction-modification methylase domain-containing protein [unclassified Rubrivirga]MDT0632261.1 TaqI-like C-terminal specificity domain-containing protein [Rubrivirga sp. F394]MDT7856289.1 TaqI-like C-terminal specificity domain-containing protein [Rubrivirga sp. S365]
MKTLADPAVQFDIFGGVSRSGAVEAAVEAMATAPAEARGAVHTKPDIARFVLDLAGWRTSADLLRMRLLEPSFGTGVFLIAAVRRLLDVWEQTPDRTIDQLRGRIRAVEVHRATAAATRSRLLALLADRAIPEGEAYALLDEWLRQDDFLLTPLDGPFDVVVGNPPYVRQDAVAAPLVARYRADYETVYDRADLYVPFIERGLRLLSDGGHLTYICADRWMKNRYGGPLREMVTRGYALRHVVTLHGADVFDAEVDAYPSVFTIQQGRAQRTQIAVVENPSVGPADLARLAKIVTRGGEAPTGEGDDVRMVTSVGSGSAPWVLEASDALDLLRRLEHEHPTIQDAQCRVGIGVATGADRVFIRPAPDLPIEPDRVLPLAVAKDVREDGTLQWSGRALANPFDDEGALVDIGAYPLLRAYLESHGEVVRNRHVARKAPQRWYRTIDKVRPGLRETPKLLIPDIKGGAVVAYDPGELYPHHNLYFVTSDEWDVRALQAVLRSRVAEFQVAAYAVRMRGGYLRFQAQYLRRIRLPRWSRVPALQRRALAAAAVGPREACDQAARELFSVSDAEWATICETLEN